ncbi:hypothetical protein HK100_006364 [Physocladia obscura]|uniref:Uncharacterized protein n=1 Tax=Physocladia obscura TaxID=109957 RepID=A0AAD5X8U1_9FUNG|nr:hypothetical protein HK100_006364 [Physocladia obscura]
METLKTAIQKANDVRREFDTFHQPQMASGASSETRALITCEFGLYSPPRKSFDNAIDMFKTGSRYVKLAVDDVDLFVANVQDGLLPTVDSRQHRLDKLTKSLDKVSDQFSQASAMLANSVSFFKQGLKKLESDNVAAQNHWFQRAGAFSFGAVFLFVGVVRYFSDSKIVSISGGVIAATIAEIDMQGNKTGMLYTTREAVLAQQALSEAITDLIDHIEELVELTTPGVLVIQTVRLTLMAYSTVALNSIQAPPKLSVTSSQEVIAAENVKLEKLLELSGEIRKGCNMIQAELGY